MGFVAQATYWSAVDLHKAVMTNICEALNRPIRELHPEIATALTAKTDLLLSEVGVGEHARVTIENEASKFYEASPWAADKRASEIVRPAPVQTADRVPPKSLALDMALRRYTVKCFQSRRPSCSVREDLALVRVGRPCTNHRRNCHRMRNGGWPRRYGFVLRWTLARDLALTKGNDGDTCEQSLAVHAFHPFCCKYGEPETGRIAQSSAHCAGSSSRHGAM